MDAPIPTAASANSRSPATWGPSVLLLLLFVLSEASMLPTPESTAIPVAGVVAERPDDSMREPPRLEEQAAGVLLFNAPPELRRFC